MQPSSVHQLLPGNSSCLALHECLQGTTSCRSLFLFLFHLLLLLSPYSPSFLLLFSRFLLLFSILSSFHRFLFSPPCFPTSFPTYFCFSIPYLFLLLHSPPFSATIHLWHLLHLCRGTNVSKIAGFLPRNTRGTSYICVVAWIHVKLPVFLPRNACSISYVRVVSLISAKSLLSLP